MSPNTNPGQSVPEDLPHHERGPHAGQHHDGEPFRDSELGQTRDRLHEVFETVHYPEGDHADEADKADEAADDAGEAGRADGAEENSGS